MSFTSNQNKIRNFSIIAGLFTLAMVIGFKSVADTDKVAKSYIISAKNFSVLKNNLKALGVTPTHELKIIDSVAVDLTDKQLSNLQNKQEITVSSNYKVELSGLSYGQRRWQP